MNRWTQGRQSLGRYMTRRERACLLKVKHGSWRYAQGEAARMSRLSRHEFRAYTCTQCGGIHIGKIGKSTRPASTSSSEVEPCPPSSGQRDENDSHR